MDDPYSRRVIKEKLSWVIHARIKWEKSKKRLEENNIRGAYLYYWSSLNPDIQKTEDMIKLYAVK